jgi:isoleucyl-tRNA synthetase
LYKPEGKERFIVAISYKDTMNLPKTDFPMRGNLPQNEPKRLERWQEQDIYRRVLEKNADGKPYVLHDGPPYANGPIHIGHAFNKILKDFVIKSHAQRGYFTPYIPGWDCHGQPIEHMVEVTLGPEKMAEISQPELRQACRAWAERFIDIQRDGFKRLGVNADWEHPYLTFIPNYEAGNVEVFKDLYLKGSIYRGRKPIHWCTNCHTALAEAEIEYSDEISPSIYVKFKLDVMPGVFEAHGAVGDAFLLIWTTTPWTLPANTAVSLAPDADYVMLKTPDGNIIMAKELIETVAEVAGWKYHVPVTNETGEVVALKGKELFGLTYTAPIRNDIKGTVIYGDHVTLDTGTGAVHTAPGHGQDDYLVGLEFDIPLLMPVDDNGVFTNEAGQFAGLSVDDANPQIIAWLKENGMLVAEKKINHSYPHCWRCHKPVIFRATDQWFVSMDKNSLREDALRAINSEVEWVPAWAKNRIGSMVADRPDWCISRQRSWGVPIPVFKCAHCGSTVATEETFDAVIELFNTKGADAWFTEEPSSYLPRNTKCEVCGGTDLLPEKDILDVWWESGVSHTSVCKHRSEADGLRFPADLYLEGSDQHRGWFQSSLLTSIGAYGVPPFKSVMHCGFTVDEQGRKMSKSLGNGIDPAEVCDKFGADVLRLWVSSTDYSQDVSISDSILKQVSDAYRRFRNTFRFLLGSLEDFAPENAIQNWDDLEPIDQHALVRLMQLLAEVEAGYEQLKFSNVYRALYDYVNDISAIYMDVTKDRMYAEAPDSPRRRAAQTVLFNILEVLVRVMAPILSFTADEVWECYPPAYRTLEGRPESAQLAGWPTLRDFVPSIPADALEQTAAFEELVAVREDVTKALEEARNEKLINKSQEAAVHISAPAAVVSTLNSFDKTVLEELFIVAAVTVEEGEEVAVTISQAEGEKCPRCWNIRTLGGNAHHADVCERCGDVLDVLGISE